MTACWSGGDLNEAKKMLEDAGYVTLDGGALRYPAGKKEMLAGG